MKNAIVRMGQWRRDSTQFPPNLWPGARAAANGANRIPLLTRGVGEITPGWFWPRPRMAMLAACGLRLSATGGAVTRPGQRFKFQLWVEL